ncbi:hypothetical protein [Streptomyces sp. NPDC088755]|uniref:hypothetical protein n=1 Tax=Streptomyces sp. NPDC088755 TaxID=3365888 RepID=UPI0037FEF6B4
MPNFETFTKRMAPLVKQPFVTIQKRGTISLNAAAHALLGKPEAVELLYDREESVVGFRPVPRESEHAYPLRAQNNKSVGPYIVSGTAFVKYYNIDTTVSRRWVASLVGDVLCVDLKHGGTVVTSNRSATPGSGQSDEAV